MQLEKPESSERNIQCSSAILATHPMNEKTPYLIVLLSIFAASITVMGQGTAFTYQVRRRAGDVSGVIETPSSFQLYLEIGRTDSALNVAVLSLPKRSYEQWLEEQSGN